MLTGSTPLFYAQQTLRYRCVDYSKLPTRATHCQITVREVSG